MEANLQSEAAFPENRKYLVLKNLRLLRDKAGALYEEVFKKNDQGLINTSLLETMPQMILHLSMALRVASEGTPDIDFEQIMEQMLLVSKENISQLDLEPELVQLAESIQQRDSSFNFKKDQNLTVEAIIKSAFYNPERARFQYLPDWEFLAPMSNKYSNGDDFLKMVQAVMTASAKDFDSKKVESRATNFLFSDVDKAKWLSTLDSLAWYGPFSKSADSQETYGFQSASALGETTGFQVWFTITEKSKDINVDLVQNSQKCGLSVKVSDYVVPDFDDFDVFGDDLD